jgi:ABC-type transport system involved in multi-copper enzyme maturation permease subunit
MNALCVNLWDMHALLSIASATYSELVRKPIYVITLLIFGVGLFVSQFFTLSTFAGFGGRELNVLREIGSATITLWGFIMIVVFSGQIVTQELEDRTAMVLLTKPIRRGSFLVGKFLGLLLSTTVGVVFLSIIFLITLWVTMGLPKLDYYDVARHGTIASFIWSRFLEWGIKFTLQGFFLCSCQLAIISAIAIVLSAFLPHVISAAVLSVIYLVSNISGHILGSVESTSSGVLIFIGRLFYYITPNLGYFNPQTLLSQGELASFRYLLLTLLYCIIYSCFVLYIACLIFQKREIR